MEEYLYLEIEESEEEEEMLLESTELAGAEVEPADSNEWWFKIHSLEPLILDLSGEARGATSEPEKEETVSPEESAVLEGEVLDEEVYFNSDS